VCNIKLLSHRQPDPTLSPLRKTESMDQFQFNDKLADDLYITSGYEALKPNSNALLSKSWDGNPATWNTYKYYMYNEVHAISEYGMIVLLNPWENAQELVAIKIGRKLEVARRGVTAVSARGVATATKGSPTPRPGSSTATSSEAKQGSNLPREALSSTFGRLSSIREGTGDEELNTEAFTVTDEDSSGGLFGDNGGTPYGALEKETVDGKKSGVGGTGRYASAKSSSSRSAGAASTMTPMQAHGPTLEKLVVDDVAGFRLTQEGTGRLGMVRRRLVALINNTIRKSAIRMVRAATKGVIGDPYLMWKGLARVDRDSDSKLTRVYSNIADMKHTEGKPIMTLIDNLDQLYDSLERLETRAPSDKYKSAHLLRALPPSYDAFKAALANVPQPPYDVLCDRVMNHYEVIRHKKKQTGGEEQLLSTWESVKKGERKKKKHDKTDGAKEDKKKKECYNCQKKGHIQLECRGECKWKKCTREGTHARKDCYKPNKKQSDNKKEKQTETENHDALFGLWLFAEGSEEAEESESEEVAGELGQLNLSSLTDFPPLPTGSPLPTHISTTIAPTPTTPSVSTRVSEGEGERERKVRVNGVWGQQHRQHQHPSSNIHTSHTHDTHSYTSSHILDLDRKHHGEGPHEGIDSAGTRGREEAERETSNAALLHAGESPRETRPTPATGRERLGADGEGKTGSSVRGPVRSTTTQHYQRDIPVYTTYTREVSEVEYKNAIAQNKQAEAIDRLANQWNDEVTRLEEWTMAEKIVDYMTLHTELSEHGSPDEMQELVEDCNFTVIGPPDWATRAVNECDVCRTGTRGEARGPHDLSSPFLPLTITYDQGFVVTLPVHTTVPQNASHPTLSQGEMKEQENEQGEEEDDEEESDEYDDDSDLPSLEGDDDDDNDDYGSGAETGNDRQERDTAQDNQHHHQERDREERQSTQNTHDGWGHSLVCKSCTRSRRVRGKQLIKHATELTCCECRCRFNSVMVKEGRKCAKHNPPTYYLEEWVPDVQQLQHYTTYPITTYPQQSRYLMWSHMYNVNTDDDDWMFAYSAIDIPELISSSDDETDEDEKGENNDEFVGLAAESNKGTTNHINNIIDSGASKHVLCSSQTVSKKKTIPPRAFNTASGPFTLDTVASTNIYVLKNDKKTTEFELKDAFVCNRLNNMNLISVSELDREGKYVLFGGGAVNVLTCKPSFADNKVLAIGRLNDKHVYKLLDPRNPNDHNSVDSIYFTQPLRMGPIDAEKFHARWNHPGRAATNLIRGTYGIDRAGKKTDEEVIAKCPGCRRGKAKKQAHHKHQPLHREEKPGLGWHWDLSGKISITLWGGHKYVFVAVDDYTSLIVCQLIKTKDEQLMFVKKLLAWSETQTGNKCKWIRSDGEWIQGEFLQLCDDRGIEHRMTTPGDSDANPRAERMIGMMFAKARAALVSSGLPLNMFGFAISHAAYTHNIIPTARHKRSPAAMFYGHQPQWAHLRPFGCKCYVHMPKADKIDAQAEEGRLLGYNRKQRAYIVLVGSKVVISRNVDFDETVQEKGTNNAYGKTDFTAGHGGSKSTDDAEFATHPPQPVISAIEPNHGLITTNHIAEDQSQIQNNNQHTPPTPQNAKGGGDEVGESEESDDNDDYEQFQSPTQSPTKIAFSEVGQTNEQTESEEYHKTDTAPSDHKKSFTTWKQTNDPLDKSWIIEGKRERKSTQALRSDPEERPGLGQRLKAAMVKAVPAADQDKANPISLSPTMQKIAEENKEGLMIMLSVGDAMKDEGWRAAMQKEIDMFKKLGTGEIVERPDGRKVIKGKWVFNVKNDGTKKARYVARGDYQEPYLDYSPSKTYAAKLLMRSLLIITAFAACSGATLSHIDISSAYLHAVLDEEIYVEMPHGYDEKEVKEQASTRNEKKKVLRLRKAMYGLKQSDFAWNREFDGTITNNKGLKFQRCKLDPCLYYAMIEGKPCWIGLRTDDIILMHYTDAQKEHVLNGMRKRYDVRDEGRVKIYCGLQFTFTPSHIKVHQPKYASMLLEHYGYSHSNPTPTPVATDILTSTPRGEKAGNKSESKSGDSGKSLKTFDQREIMGSLLWLSHTRPDLALAVNLMGRYMGKSEKFYEIAARTLRYIKGTIDKGLAYNRQNKGYEEVIGYVDSDYAGDTEDRKSQTGYVFLWHGCPISWRSQKQSVVTLSSTEAELVAAVEATREAVAIRSLLGELGLPVVKATPIYEDNNGALLLSKGHIGGGAHQTHICQISLCCRAEQRGGG